MTRDAGQSWKDATGNLAEATATIAQARLAGLLLVDFAELGASALLTGTVNGAFLSWTDNIGSWSRLGTCDDLPLVLVAGLSYEPYSDVLIASTFGRGVYVLKKAKEALAKARAQQDAGSCDATMLWTPSSSAASFPEQVSAESVLV